jgi:hypothetical protein
MIPMLKFAEHLRRDNDQIMTKLIDKKEVM